MDLNLDKSIAKEPPASKGLRDLWYSKGGTAFRRFIAAVVYRLFRLGGELTAVLLGLAIAFSWMATVVLDKQSFDLSILRPNIKIWFAEAFAGRDAEFGRLDLRWLPATDRFVVTLEDAEVLGASGERLEHFDLIRVTLVKDGNGLKPPKLVNAEIKGGILSYLEDEDGLIIAGLGMPDAVGQFGPVYRNTDARKSDNDYRNILQDIEFIQINDAAIYVRNAISGVEFKSNVDSFRAAVSDNDVVTLSSNGHVDQPSGQMPFTFTSELDPAFQNFKMRLNIEDARLDEVAPTKGRFWELQGLAAPMDLSVAVDFSRRDGLKSAEVNMNVGAGSFTLLRNKKPRTFPLNSLTMRSSLARGEERMDIGQLDLNSPNLKFKASGFMTELGKLSDGDENSSPTFNLSFADVQANFTPRLSQVTNIKALNVVGQADADSRELTIERGLMAIFESRHIFDGRLKVNDINELEAFELNTAMSGTLLPDEFLSLWPVEAIGGARRWIDRAVLSGDITRLDAEISLDEAFFAAPALTDERFKLFFGGENIDVQYMLTLPKAAGVRGQGEIIGNRLSLDFSGGNIDGALLNTGTVEIPVLLPKGGNILISANGTGQASDLLRLADNPPFEIASRYNVDPGALNGQGDISLQVTRPLLEFFPREEILYQVNGSFSGVNAPFEIGPLEITNGTIEMDANRDRVIMSGPVDIGPWRADISWEETFGDVASLTQYKVSGVVTADVLDELGYASRSWFDGSADVSIEAQGRGRDIVSAKLDVDLSNSELSAERVWMKPEAEPARLQGNLKRSASSGYIFEDLALTGQGIEVSGRAELDADFKTQTIDLTNVQIESLIDGALRITPNRLVGQLGVEIDARYLDISPWTDDLFAQRQSNLDVPLLLRGEIDQLILDPNYTVTDSTVDFSHTGEVIETARLEALSDGQPLQLELSTRKDLKRQLVATVPDASKAVQAFLGMDNTTGGQLEVTMNLPAAGEEGAYVGEANMRDFRLTEAPAMAQLLSLASLTGLADTLTSGSMQFDRFQLPFTMLGDDIAIRDARLYGPALGMTANGDVNLDLRVLDFDGTLVPAYTANSILGDIPVLGEIFAQEKGGGLFALTYTVSGPFEKTQIAVNPLSALTPGFLRGIFKRDRSGIDDAMREAIEDVTPKPAEGP